MKRKRNLKALGEWSLLVISFALGVISMSLRHGQRELGGVVFETRMPDTVVAKCCYCLKENTYTNFIKIN